MQPIHGVLVFRLSASAAAIFMSRSKNTRVQHARTLFVRRPLNFFWFLVPTTQTLLRRHTSLRILSTMRSASNFSPVPANVLSSRTHICASPLSPVTLPICAARWMPPSLRSSKIRPPNNIRPRAGIIPGYRRQELSANWRFFFQARAASMLAWVQTWRWLSTRAVLSGTKLLIWSLNRAAGYMKWSSRNPASARMSVLHRKRACAQQIGLSPLLVQ